MTPHRGLVRSQFGVDRCDRSRIDIQVSFASRSGISPAGDRCAKLGFTKAIIPKANVPKGKIEGMEVFAVERLEQALKKVREM